MTFQQEIEAKANSLGLLTDCISSGPTTAEIAFISTSPGEVEAQTKKPFTGGSGTYLWNTVHKVCGLNRNNVYATNVVKRFTGKTFNEDEQRINKHELSLWISLLHWELSRLPNLKYVVILGAEALDALMNEKGITNWRGSIVNVNIGSRTVQGLVTFNPALVTRMNSMLRKKHVVVPVRNADYIFKLDIAKLKALLAGRLSPYIIQHYINPTISEALDFIADLRRDKLPVSFDIETFANETACIGFANKNDAGMCIPFYSSSREHYWPIEDEIRIRRSIQEVLSEKDIPLVAQNGIFDCIWLWYKDRIRVNPLYMDTLLAHHTLFPTLPHSLQFLTAQYTTHPYYKDDKSGWQKDEDADRFWRYNVTDACVTLAVSQVLDRKLVKEKMDGFFYNHVMAAQPHLIELCIRGFKCDVGYKQIITSHFEADLSRTLDEFHRACQLAVNDPEYTPNPASPKQMGELYFRKLKLVGRSTSTNVENRNYMAEHPNTSALARQVIDLHNVYQKQAKFLGTYLGSEVDDDGRLRTEYKQFGTQRAPGRLSSSQTPWGTGMNFQNQPQAAYPMFVADDGMCLLYFDLSQAEARVVGWLANIDKWIDDFERARLNPGTFDCHRSLAAEMFHKPYDDIPKDDRLADGSFTERFIAKRCHVADTEVLTKSGWLSIADAASTNCEIAIWNKTYEICWEVPSKWFIDKIDEHVYEFDGESFNQCVTADHRMLVWNNSKWNERTAKDVFNKAYGSVPINGILNGGLYYPYARLRAMAWADGSIEKNYPNSVRVSVAKERKAIRVRQLANELNLDLWESFSGGLWHFRIYGIHFKALDNSLLEWDLESRKAFIDELKYWDGCIKTGRVFNTDLQGLGIIQAVAHSCGLRAPIHFHGYPRNNEQQCYLLRPTKQQRSHYQSMNRYKTLYKGYVYCPTVSTGAFVVRRKHKVSVSLNCRHGLNYRMMADRLATTTGLTLSEAYKAFHLYHKINPELMVWWEIVERQVRDNGVLFSPLGRRLTFHEQLTENVLESIIAFKPQSTVGDKVVSVIYKSQEDDDWPSNASILLNNHDALIAQAPFAKAKTCLRIMKKHAEEPITIVPDRDRHKEVPPLIIPADMAMTTVGTSWKIDNNGKAEFYSDELGFHRWSDLKKVQI